jgi:hypothetical protein
MPYWLALEQEQVADRVDEREADGEVARVLRDLARAGLALLGELRQRGDDRLHHLHDDLRGDVGHDAQAENRDAREGAAREQVQHADGAHRIGGVLHLREHLREGDARQGQVRAETIEHQDGNREQELLAELGHAEGIGDPT